ncbi:MAG: DUF2442 domain-containing protein [Candidatus Tectomicrobia bacterium]|uniref:DUF2442 domain-containing protein n=1 Tax=Tectimicrobiota bacterium TaxID=2528274 RepID=A0A933LPL3_UNCTE|nr:DUF2442 domain-containing protein [Candidatus Tectomicrobia bacterium]
MVISTHNITDQVQIIAVRFNGSLLFISLSDGREISVPLDKMKWLKWLAIATPEQQAKWTIEPGGFAVYWEELDDGIELCHLLGQKPLDFN